MIGWRVMSHDNDSLPLHDSLPLRHAVHDNKVLELLLNTGADVSETDSDGYSMTALHLAAECNHPEAVKLLLDAKENVDAEDHLGRTALHLAAECWTE
jgi:ankyrin repeat protein